MDKGKQLGGEAGVIYFDEAIALFEKVLAQKGIEQDFPELACHASNNLGTAHLAKSENNDLEALNAALESFRRATALSAQANQPDIWAAAHVNTGNVLASLSDLNENADEKAFMRIQAIAAYCAAIEVYPLSFFPYQYGHTQYGLATILQAHAMALQNELTELYLLRAIGSYEEALKVFSEDSDPLMWARIQTYLGTIYAAHSELDGTTSVRHDCETAITHFQKAARVFETEGYTEQLATCSRAIKTMELKLQASPPV